GRQPPRMAGGAGGRRPAAGGHRRAYGPRRVEWRGGAGRKALDEDPRRSPHARRSRLHTACGLGPPRARARHTGPGVMLQLTVDDVRLGVRVRDKADAIRAAGRLLVERGYIEAGYVDSMLGREEQANTYLGSGVAIPHGLGKDRGLIYRTGVSVLQLADVLEWNPGQPVSLVVGLAATSDDHLGILAALTDVLEDRQLSRRLARTDSVVEIVAALTRTAVTGAQERVAAEPVETAGVRQLEVRIRGSDGLHARPAASFVEVARRVGAGVRG